MDVGNDCSQLRLVFYHAWYEVDVPNWAPEVLPAVFVARQFASLAC